MPKSKQNKGKQGQGQNKGQAKSKARPDEDLEEEEEEEEDLDLMNDNEEDDDVDDFDDEDDELFWTLVVAPGKEVMLEEPANPNSIICVTHASFGEEVNKDSRTILYCATSASENPVPICILSNGIHESHPLNLRFGSPASFSLKGRNPSTVYLSGYLQPELSPMMDGMNGMEDMEDMEDMDEDIDLEEEEPRFPGKSRKRGTPEEDIEEPTAKKRKIENQKAVETKKADSKKNTPNKPQPQPQQSQQSTPVNNQSATATATAASTAASTATSTPGGDKPLSKNQLKKQKKLQKQQGKSDDKPKEDEKTQPQETVTSTPSNTTEKKPEETPKAPEQDTSKSQKSTDTKKSNDVEIKDIKVGTGAVVQNGQTLNLYFVGQLEDKTVFEKHLTGNGFELKLGSHDTIKGLNFGLKGMKVGGKRRIIVPPKLAYGEQGNEEKKIPANSTLTFTVEVREAK